MDVTGGRRSPEKNHLKKKIRFTIKETDIFVCFSQTTSPLNDDDKLRAFHARSAFNSARCGVEVADLPKAALLNKVEQWVNPSPGEDYTPLRYHNNNTCIVLSSGAVGGNREYLRSFFDKICFFFTHRSKDDAYFQPWTRIHWYDILISTGAFFFISVGASAVDSTFTA